MKEPVWVRRDVVLAVPCRQIAEHGGAEGIRDEGLLDSALARAQNLRAYSESPPDLAALAVAYAFGLATNHPFVDGNKRTAFITCRLFLALNNTSLEAGQEEKYLTFLELASGRLSEDELASWLRARLITSKPSGA